MPDPTEHPADMTLRWGKNGEVTLKGCSTGWQCELPGGKRMDVVSVTAGSFTVFVNSARRMTYEHHGATSAQEAVDAVHGMMSGEHALLGLALGET